MLDLLSNKTKALNEIILYTQTILETTLASNLLRKLISALVHVTDMNEVSDKNSNRRSDRRTEFNLFEPAFLVFADPSGASRVQFLKGLRFQAAEMRLSRHIALILQDSGGVVGE